MKRHIEAEDEASQDMILFQTPPTFSGNTAARDSILAKCQTVMDMNLAIIPFNTQTLQKCEHVGCHADICTTHLCARHLSEEYGLAVRMSLIPNAGMGLFFTGNKNMSKILKGTRIAPYRGTRLSKEQFESLYVVDGKKKHGSYCIKLQNVAIDSRRTTDGVARFANHQSSPHNNAIFHEVHTTLSQKEKDQDMLQDVYLEAIRDIVPGEEILADYYSLDSVQSETIGFF